MPEELTAIKLSLRVAAVATLLSLPFGIAVAMLIGRVRFWGRPLLNAFVLLPLVLPPVVTGYVLLLLFGRQGPIGGWLYDTFGIVLAFRWTGAALACAIMGFPLMVRAIQLSVEAVDRRLEQAASTLGASRTWVFLTVTLPLIAPGIIAGAILAAYGLIKAEETTLWLTLVQSIAVAVIPVALAIVNYAYIKNRGTVKAAKYGKEGTESGMQITDNR